MPLMIWKSSFNTGISAVDSQHATLVGLINQLHEAMMQGKGNALMGELLDRLILYTQDHFRDEERIMKAGGYKAFEAHQKQHRMLEQSVITLAAEFRAGRVALSAKVLQFLKDWLQNHILNTDQKMAEELRGQRAVGVLTAVR